MIACVLYDFNATLIRSAPWMDLETRLLPEAALQHLASIGAIPPPGSAVQAAAASAFRATRQAANSSGRETSHVQDLSAILDAIGLRGAVSDSQIEETVGALHRACLSTVELIPRADAAIDALRARGLRLAIVSNAAYAPFLHWTLERFSLASAFEAVFVSADIGWRKPRPEIFQAALARLSLPVGSVVYVGDDFEKDVAAPKRLGLRALWFQPDPAVPTPLGDAQPDARLADPLDILDWLQPGPTPSGS
jgi:putative hydrolase of the HAD superfamily